MEKTYSQCSERVSKGNRYSRNHNHDCRDFSPFSKNDPFRIFLGVYVCGKDVVPHKWDSIFKDIIIIYVDYK